MMQKIPRFDLYCGSLIFNYSIKWQSYVNPHDNCYWQSEDIDFISIGIDNKWFDKENWYYDGHTLKSITIFRIKFAKGYFWQAEKIK